MVFLGHRCKFFEGKTWTKICSGKYSLDIHLRFGNPLVMLGERYAIFQGDPEEFLVSMGDSPIMRQQSVLINNRGQFAVPNSTKIVERISGMSCLPYKFRFTKEIVEECTRRNGVTASQSILSYPHYDQMVDRLMHRNLSRYYDNSNGAHFLGDSISWTMIALGVLLLLLIFSYRT